jgi:putative ABC transport system permease protein
MWQRLGDAAVPMVYRPYAQVPPSSQRLLMESEVPAAQLRPQLREAIRSVRGHLVDVQDLSAIVSRSIQPTLATALALGILAAIALVLAFGGLYAILTAALQTRKREIGIRVAIGATPADVAALLVGQVVAVATAGTIAGLLVVYVGATIVSAWIHTPPVNAAGVAGTVGLVVCASVLASIGPVVRANRANTVRLIQDC